MEQRVFTVGHSNQTADALIALLHGAGVTAVADVRSAPYSRFNPQFNRESLEACLKAAGIAYVFLGRELGARSEDSSCYENGKIRYERLAQTSLFRSGLARVIRGTDRHTVVILCAEKEPLDCHRTLLVSRELERQGVSVVHILPDGSLEPHACTELRMLRIVGLPERDLFRSTSDLIAAAYAMQEERIAYTKPKETEDVEP